MIFVPRVINGLYPTYPTSKDSNQSTMSIHWFCYCSAVSVFTFIIVIVFFWNRNEYMIVYISVLSLKTKLSDGLSSKYPVPSVALDFQPHMLWSTLCPVIWLRGCCSVCWYLWYCRSSLSNVSFQNCENGHKYRNRQKHRLIYNRVRFS